MALAAALSFLSYLAGGLLVVALSSWLSPVFYNGDQFALLRLIFPPDIDVLSPWFVAVFEMVVPIPALLLGLHARPHGPA